MDYHLTPSNLAFGVLNDANEMDGLLICPFADWLAGSVRPTTPDSDYTLNIYSRTVTYK